MAKYRGSWWAVRDFIIALVLLVLVLGTMFGLLITKCSPDTDDYGTVDHIYIQQRSFESFPPTEEVIDVDAGHIENLEERRSRVRIGVAERIDADLSDSGQR